MGDAILTAKLRKEYGGLNLEAQVAGNPFPIWRTWLNSKGYDLDRNDLVIPLKKQLNPADPSLR